MTETSASKTAVSVQEKRRIEGWNAQECETMPEVGCAQGRRENTLAGRAS